MIVDPAGEIGVVASLVESGLVGGASPIIVFKLLGKFDIDYLASRLKFLAEDDPLQLF